MLVHLVTDAYIYLFIYLFLYLFIYLFIVSFILFYSILFYLLSFLTSDVCFYFFFHLFCDNLPCSGMFQNVPGCSGMFHVPGFVVTHIWRAYLQFPLLHPALIRGPVFNRENTVLLLYLFFLILFVCFFVCSLFGCFFNHFLSFFFFHLFCDNLPCPGMFRMFRNYVSGCSGMFRGPGFVDARNEAN